MERIIAREIVRHPTASLKVVDNAANVVHPLDRHVGTCSGDSGTITDRYSGKTMTAPLGVGDHEKCREPITKGAEVSLRS